MDNGYLVISYQEWASTKTTDTRRFYLIEEVFKYIDELNSDGKRPKVSIFKIGDCLLDWS
jgi:hypothetical protein